MSGCPGCAGCSAGDDWYVTVANGWVEIHDSWNSDSSAIPFDDLRSLIEQLEQIERDGPESKVEGPPVPPVDYPGLFSDAGNQALEEYVEPLREEFEQRAEMESSPTVMDLYRENVTNVGWPK
jgi:hypothetical protein